MHTQNKPVRRKKRRDPVSVNQLLDNSRLSQLLNQAKFISQANEYLHAILPEQLIAHCQIANIRDQTLVIYTPNSAIATQLHLQQHRILEAMQSHPEFSCILRTHIQVKAAPR